MYIIVINALKSISWNIYKNVYQQTREMLNIMQEILAHTQTIAEKTFAGQNFQDFVKHQLEQIFTYI